MSALFFTIQEGGDAASYMITILSMTFTIVSILISVFEHKMKSKFLKKGCVIVSRFSIKSQELSQLRKSKFDSRVVFKKQAAVYSIAKCVELSPDQVERLIPLQHKHGATVTFIMELNDQKHFENVADLLGQAINDKSLDKVMFVMVFCFFYLLFFLFLFRNVYVILQMINVIVQLQEFQFIYHLNDGARIDPSSLVVMKLQQMKREKSESCDQVGNQSTSVTLRDKFISSPKMMPHPFKRRDTTAIEMFEGLEKVTSNSSRQEVKQDLAPNSPTTTQIVLQHDITPATGGAAGDIHQAPMQTLKLKQGEPEEQPNEDYKPMPVVAQSTHEDSTTELDTDDDYKS